MADLDFALVIGRFGINVGDGADPNETPDTIWCDEGILRIAPLQSPTKVPDGAPMPFTTGNAAIDTTFDANGHVTWNGKPRVWVVDLTSEKLIPHVDEGDATHRVSYIGVKANGVAVEFPPANVRLAADTMTPGIDPETGEPIMACDLTKLLPVQVGPGVAIVVGDQGVSVTGVVQETPGEVAFALSDGTTTDPVTLPAGPAGGVNEVAGLQGDITAPALFDELEPFVTAQIDAALAGPAQVAVAGAAPLAVGAVDELPAALPSRALVVPDSVHEWWCWPVARRVGRVTCGAGYGGNGEIVAWDRHDRDGLRSVVVGDAGVGGPGGEVDDHDAPARWVSDDGGFSVIFWQNHGDTDYFSVRVSLDGTAAGFLRQPEVPVVLAAGAVVSYTQAFLQSVSGDEYTFWVLTRSSSGWPIKVVTINRATGTVTAGPLRRTVTIGGDQPYVTAVQQGRILRLAAYVNPAYDVHAIWLFHLDLDTGIMTNVMGGASHDTAAGSYLNIAPLTPFVPETATTGTSRRLYYASPAADRVLYSEWERGSEQLATYREASRTGSTLHVRVLGPAAGPRNGYTANANYNPGAAYSPSGALIATLHNDIDAPGGQVHVHSSNRTWLTQRTAYRLSRPMFLAEDELMMLAVDHYTDYFNFLMHQVSIVGLPEIEGSAVVTHPLATEAGTLWLIDPTFTPAWGAGIPATVPNLAGSASATLAHTMFGGLVERTSKGALHAAAAKSATGNQSLTLTHAPTRDALLAALTAGHEVFMGEVYRVTRAPDVGFAPTTATTRYMGIINTGSGDFGDIRTNSVQAVRGYPAAGVLHEQAGTATAAAGVQAVMASMVPTISTVAGSSTAVTIHHNGGAGSPMQSRIMYLSIIEDLTVSGRTYAEVAALVNAWIATEFGPGGRYADDTWTAP